MNSVHGVNLGANFRNVNLFNNFDPKRGLKAFTGSIADIGNDFKVWDDAFKPAGKLGKIAKVAGAAGTFVSFIDSVNTNFTNSSDPLAQKITNFTTDFALDAGSSAVLYGVVAAFGPAGIAVAIGVDILVNLPLGNPPKSVVDHTKDFVKDKLIGPFFLEEVMKYD